MEEEPLALHTPLASFRNEDTCFIYFSDNITTVGSQSTLQRSARRLTLRAVCWPARRSARVWCRRFGRNRLWS